jgi:hypothetical protein
MNSIAKFLIDAHGGLDRWKQFEKMSAHLVQGGVLWPLKGQAGKLDDTNVTVGLRTEWGSHSPFGAPDRKSKFEPDRVAIEAADGRVLDELREPRKSFAGHSLQTPWTDLQLAYFVGTAMWTYLNMPFVLAWPGVACEELSSWSENGESWGRLEITFPDTIATHCSRQTLYFDKAGLLKRHDYDVEIAGNTPGAHYMDSYIEVSGIKIPTVHRIFARQPDASVNRDPLVVSIDISNIQLS